MGVARERDSEGDDGATLATIIAVQNPGDTECGRTPPPMLAVPVSSSSDAVLEGADGAASDGGAAAPDDEAVILHVHCSGCSLVVQFPLIPDVRRHGIVCSVCGTVSFPIVDAHLTLEDGAIALPLSPQRAAEVRAMAILSMERAIGALELERDAAAAAARGGSGGGGGGARRSVYPLSSALARSHNLTPSAALVVNLGRLIKWLAVFSIFAVTVEVLMGTTVALFAPYQPALLIVLIAPILGYIGAARLEPRLVLVLVVFSFMLIAYSSFVTYLQPTVWKLLLLIQQVYMCRVVLRLFLLLNRAPAADRAQLLAELRANGRATLLPW